MSMFLKKMIFASSALAYFLGAGISPEGSTSLSSRALKVTKMHKKHGKSKSVGGVPEAGAGDQYNRRENANQAPAAGNQRPKDVTRQQKIKKQKQKKQQKTKQEAKRKQIRKLQKDLDTIKFQETVIVAAAGIVAMFVMMSLSTQCGNMRNPFLKFFLPFVIGVLVGMFVGVLCYVVADWCLHFVENKMRLQRAIENGGRMPSPRQLQVKKAQ